jgi:hypothetical protein
MLNKAVAIDGNTNAPYYSVYIEGAIDLFDAFNIENRAPQFSSIGVQEFADNLSYDSSLADVALESMNENEPIIPVPVIKQGSQYEPLDFPHLIVASREYGFAEVPCIVATK